MRLGAIVSATVVLAFGGHAIAQQEPVSGSGQAQITKDVESVRAIAEEGAREDVVRNLARQTIGAERLPELTPDLVQRLAHQIRDDMIIDRSSSRVGATFQVTVTARVDKAWFQARLDDEGIRMSADQSGAERQPIFVMLEEITGAARDTDKPAEIVTRFDHTVGAEFQDKSSAAYAEKDNAARTRTSQAASRSSIAGAAGYSGEYGAAGERIVGSGAQATSDHSAAASAHAVAAVSRTDVAASSHDDTHFYQNISYQTSSKTGPAQAGRDALTSALQRYGVFMADSDVELASYFKGTPPTYSTLRASAVFRPFLTSLASRQVAPFFMGGTIKLQDAGRDPATGQATCSGQLDAKAYLTSSSLDIASGTANATAAGVTYEDCSAKVAKALAVQAADVIGPQVQSYWRRQLRKTAAIVASSGSAMDYTLTVHGAALTMDIQADLLDALGATPGVEKQIFLGQSGNQMSFQVRYAGAVPLQLALYQKLRGKVAFSQMQPTTEGQSIDICLSGCAKQ